MATEDDLRAIALSLPETEERPTYGKRPGWRVRGRGFVHITKHDETAVLMVDGLAEKEAMLAEAPEKFFSTPHHRDSARLLVRLPAVEVDELRELVTESWRLHAPADLLDEL